MSRPVLAALLALLLVGGAAVAYTPPTPPQPEYPDDVMALGEGWLREVGARIEPYADRSWFAEMDGFYQKAKREVEEGRLRAAMFDLETTLELLRGNLLLEETEGRSEAERKARVIERTQQWRADAEVAWQDFRARLHTVDGELGSLHALETALYAADVALTAKLNLETYTDLVPEFRKVNFSRATTLDMIRASATPSVDLGFADDILTVALAHEGLPPQLNETRWLQRYALPELNRTQGDDRLQMWEEIAVDVRANGEGILAVAIGLAEQRTLRQQQIALTYGDAGSRGIDVVTDAARYMERRLNRTSYDDVRPHGLTGVVTADAIDQARFVLEFAKEGKAQLPFITATWANLDHQEFVAMVLADVSPVEPDVETNLGFQNDLTRYTPTEEKKQDSPGPALAATLAGLAAVAALLGPRARRR